MSVTTMQRRRRTPTIRDREDIFGQAIENMPDEYLQCRDVKHPWEVVRDYHLVDAEREEGIYPRHGHNVYVRRLLRCPRCGKKRSDAFIVATKSRWQALERLGSTYEDPPGYGVAGIGHLPGTGDMIRGEAYRRVMGG
jgi:hypothetical protein